MIKRVKVLIVSVATAWGSLAAAQAQPWNGGIWHLRKTDQGCLYYYPSSSTPAEEKKERRTWYFSITWEGSRCTPGALINGTGSLVEVQNLAVISADGPGKSVVRRSGTMVDGLWNGTVTQTEIYRGSPAYSPVHTNYAMGCASGGSSDRCVPPGSMQRQQPDGTRPTPPVLADAGLPAQPPAASPADSGNVWGTCISTEGPEQSGIQMIYYLRNRCTKTVTVSFCMKATYEAAGDWNLCSQRSYKTYDIKAGTRFEFPFTPVRPGDAMSDGRVVDHQEVSASGAACIGSSPSVYVENKTLVFQHC